MSKFMSWNFVGLVLVAMVLLVVHELGHYIAYRLLGHQAVVRKSILAPGIDPVRTIEVPRWQGIFIALAGFAFSTPIIVLPLLALRYPYWSAILICSGAGSIVDIVWAASMLGHKTVTIHAKGSERT